jgi:hypothetical protein
LCMVGPGRAQPARHDHGCGDSHTATHGRSARSHSASVHPRSVTCWRPRPCGRASRKHAGRVDQYASPESRGRDPRAIAGSAPQEGKCPEPARPSGRSASKGG